MELFGLFWERCRRRLLKLWAANRHQSRNNFYLFLALLLLLLLLLLISSWILLLFLCLLCFSIGLRALNGEGKKGLGLRGFFVWFEGSSAPLFVILLIIMSSFFLFFDFLLFVRKFGEFYVRNEGK